MIALLDANLFVPTWIIDPLLSLAEAGLCEPAWSARVMDEARLAIMEVRHVPDVRARGFLDAICRAFPMAMAEDWERFEPDVNLSDSNDGHVVAAARPGPVRKPSLHSTSRISPQTNFPGTDCVLNRRIVSLPPCSMHIQKKRWTPCADWSAPNAIRRVP